MPLTTPPTGTTPADSAPLEVPAFLVIREGTALRPSVRFCGKMGTLFSVPASDIEKALTASERLLRQMYGQSKAAAQTEPPAEDTGPVEITLEDIAGSIAFHANATAETIEALSREIAGLREALSVPPPAPPPPAEDEETIWRTLAAQDAPPNYVTQPLQAFDREKALTFAWWGRDVRTGNVVCFPPEDEERRAFLRAVIAAVDVSELPPVETTFYGLMIATQTPVDVAFYALLTGRLRPSSWIGNFLARPLEEFNELTGKSLEFLVTRDMGPGHDLTPGLGG
jgi:hypothetical protein